MDTLEEKSLSHSACSTNWEVESQSVLGSWPGPKDNKKSLCVKHVCVLLALSIGQEVGLRPWRDSNHGSRDSKSLAN